MEQELKPCPNCPHCKGEGYFPDREHGTHNEGMINCDCKYKPLIEAEPTLTDEARNAALESITEALMDPDTFDTHADIVEAALQHYQDHLRNPAKDTIRLDALYEHFRGTQDFAIFVMNKGGNGGLSEFREYIDGKYWLKPQLKRAALTAPDHSEKLAEALRWLKREAENVMDYEGNQDVLQEAEQALTAYEASKGGA